MKVEIYPRRRNGFIVRNAESAPPLAGELVIGQHWLSETVTRPAAVLRRPDSVHVDAVIAVLYEPQIKSMHGDRFVLSGWEMIDRGADGKQVLFQEWPCRVTAY